jgi:superfamily II DNA/RNA helicase
VPLRFGGLSPNQNHKIEASKLDAGLDCVVSTFERLQHRRDREQLFISNVRTLVFDEFDTLVDSGLEDKIRIILDQYLKDGPKQVIFASATVSKQMRKVAADYFGDGQDPRGNFREFVEKSTHMNLQHLKHEFIHLADYDKVKPLKLLMKEFKKYARKHNTSCIVFCNSVNSARAIEHALSEDGFKTASMHGDIPPRMRDRNYERFKT